MFPSLYYIADTTCGDTFQVNSTCYKVYKNERVNWFAAVNRCRSKNATLAVFDDNILQYFPSSVLTDEAWIGLLKSRWTWPGAGQCASFAATKTDNINPNVCCCQDLFTQLYFTTKWYQKQNRNRT